MKLRECYLSSQADIRFGALVCIYLSILNYKLMFRGLSKEANVCSVEPWRNPTEKPPFRGLGVCPLLDNRDT